MTCGPGSRAINIASSRASHSRARGDDFAVWNIGGKVIRRLIMFESWEQEPAPGQRLILLNSFN
ncbi:hypothetical protein GCM10017322_40100 [Paracoccus aerius]|nr:hypothetical protein GCM10017322_40100 [Paracoccus aerius]